MRLKNLVLILGVLILIGIVINIVGANVICNYPVWPNIQGSWGFRSVSGNFGVVCNNGFNTFCTSYSGSGYSSGDYRCGVPAGNVNTGKPFCKDSSGNSKSGIFTYRGDTDPGLPQDKLTVSCVNGVLETVYVTQCTTGCSQISPSSDKPLCKYGNGNNFDGYWGYVDQGSGNDYVVVCHDGYLQAFCNGQPFTGEHTPSEPGFWWFCNYSPPACVPNCVGKQCGDDGCGTPCPPGCSNAHGTPGSCSGAGLCQAPVCTPANNYGNCDGDNTNGCEADLFTNTNNCGTCGNVCSNSHGTTSCSSGTCNPTCTPSTDWGNCDSNPTNGCETNLKDNSNDCGSCGHHCIPVQQTCSGGTCIYVHPPGAAEWQNMMRNSIIAADLNDTVRLVINRPDLGLETKNIDYKIYKDIGGIWGFFFGDKKVAQFTTLGFTTWRVNQSGDYYFNATAEDYPNEMYKSNTLTVSNSVDDTPPTIIIVRPEENSNYTIGYTGPNNGKTNPIPFKAIINDPDDDVNVVWNFGDGNTTTSLNCLTDLTTNNNCNSSHQYNAPGTKIINVTAIETTRPKTFTTNLTRIYIYNDSLILFLIVDSPNYRLRSLSGPFTVSAKSTHVANCTDVSLAECQGPGKSCYTIVDSDINPSANNLWCYQFANSCVKNFTFTWDFDGVVDTIHSNCTEFTKFFPESADHKIGLRAVYKVD